MQHKGWIGKMQSKKVTTMAVVMLASGVASATLFAGCSSQGRASATTVQSDAPVLVEAVKVSARKLDLMIHLPGELQPYEEVRVFPRVSGFVKSISVDRGSVVHRGQLIAVLSAPEIVAQKAEAQAKMLSAENQRIAGEAKLAADKSTYERLKDAARTPGVISDQELDTAQKTAEADQARVIALRNTTEAARANLRSATEMESYLRITAPFDGVVTKRNVHPGALVGPAGGSGSQPSMLRIEQVAHLRLVVAVPEIYVAGVQKGAVVDFTVPAFPGRVFHGTIARLADSVDVSTRTMPVELDVANPKAELYSGMFPDVQWRVSRTQPVLVVPSAAIGRNMDQSFVMRIRHGQVEQVIVKTGGTADGMTEVFGSLQQGDVIARQVTDDLHTGVPVDAHLVM
ncbi:efflux transporter, RND family, MFP subunit [Acidobacterium capsulatum ATCC 51196]|uniref:Efflux transporter, RND family, MFP subunit n=3 Tax=Acidobacterium TaxID=33973 RepID=C1F4A0_ACIC5|nr:efflux transporter, RND family, MFP subunit [Acidobacterium capsulatum ATCC 51196]